MNNLQLFNVFTKSAQRVIIFDKSSNKVIPTSDGEYSYSIGVISAVLLQLGVITDPVSNKEVKRVLGRCKTAQIITDDEQPYGVTFDEEGNPTFNNVTDGLTDLSQLKRPKIDNDVKVLNKPVEQTIMIGEEDD